MARTAFGPEFSGKTEGNIFSQAVLGKRDEKAVEDQYKKLSLFLTEAFGISKKSIPEFRNGLETLFKEHGVQAKTFSKDQKFFKESNRLQGISLTNMQLQLGRVVSGINTLAQGAWKFVKKVLVFLLLMAIFDPRGVFLKSMLQLGLNLLSKFLGFIVSSAPPIIERMLMVLQNTLPQLLQWLVKKLFPLLGGMLTKLTTSLEKTNLGPLLKFFLDIVNKIGNLLKDKNFIDSVANLTNYLPDFIKGLIGFIAIWNLLIKPLSLIANAIISLKIIFGPLLGLGKDLVLILFNGIKWIVRKVFQVFAPTLFKNISGVFFKLFRRGITRVIPRLVLMIGGKGAAKVLTTILTKVIPGIGWALLFLDIMYLLRKPMDMFFTWVEGIGGKIDKFIWGLIDKLPGPLKKIIGFIYKLNKISLKLTSPIYQVYKLLRMINKGMLFLDKHFFKPLMKGKKGWKFWEWDWGKAIRNLFSEIWKKLKLTFFGLHDMFANVVVFVKTFAQNLLLKRGQAAGIAAQEVTERLRARVEERIQLDKMLKKRLWKDYIKKGKGAEAIADIIDSAEAWRESLSKAKIEGKFRGRKKTRFDLRREEYFQTRIYAELLKNQKETNEVLAKVGQEMAAGYLKSSEEFWKRYRELLEKQHKEAQTVRKKTADNTKKDKNATRGSVADAFTGDLGLGTIAFSGGYGT